MAERLTKRYKDFRCPKCGEVISSASDVEFYQSRLQAQPEIAKALAKLAHYEDLEEQGRLIIVPESFNVKTAVECITEKFCPSTFGLNNYTERCGHDDCKGCWEAALKGAEHDT